MSKQAKLTLLVVLACCMVALAFYANVQIMNDNFRDSCFARWRDSGYEARFDDAGCRVRVGDKWFPDDAVKVK